MTRRNRAAVMHLVASVLTCLVAGPCLAGYLPGDVEAITGGTFLNFRAAAEERNGMSISAVVLGENVIDPRNSSSVNWSVDDTSDSAFFVDGKCVEDNNRRSSSPPYVGASYNPFSVTLGGLTASSTYELKIVALGRRDDPTNPTTDLDALRPDIGIDSYDFSYGSSAAALTNVSNTAAGTLLWEARAANPISLNSENYYYYTGLYSNDVGQFTATANGEIKLFMGEGAVNLFTNGARTMLDGVVLSEVPEPSTLVLLGLGMAAVWVYSRRRRP